MDNQEKNYALLPSGFADILPPDTANLSTYKLVLAPALPVLGVPVESKALSGMVKRNAPDAETIALNLPADLEAFAKSLG